MSKYSPTLALDLLKAEKNGITLADYLQSAIGNTILEFTGDDDLAVFAMADDLLPGLLENFSGLDFNRYEVEPMPAPIHEIKPATSKPLTAAEHGDKTALNGNTVAYNIGHEVLEALYKVPADEALTFFDAEGAEDLESTLQWWHENINDEA